MDLGALAQLDPATLRSLFPAFLSGFIVDPEASANNRERVGAVVSDWSDDTVRSVLQTLTSSGESFTFYPANPACRSLNRAWSRDAIPGHTLVGVEHLRAAADAGPAIVLCNHFAYYDANATDAILAWEGHADLADRLFYAAGPKVFQAMFRRVAASCLNTVLVPQSTQLSHTDRLAPRELAKRAIQSMDAAREAVAGGHILLLYPEGSRTRTGRMQSFLKGVHRYLALGDGLQVVPATIVGTDTVMSVGSDERIVPSEVTLTFLPALRVDDAPGTRAVLAEAHTRIAAALPEVHRPEPGTPPVA